MTMSNMEWKVFSSSYKKTAANASRASCKPNDPLLRTSKVDTPSFLRHIIE